MLHACMPILVGVASPILEILVLLLFCETNNLLDLLYLFLFPLLGRFFFSTPFTPGGKAHGGLHEQWMKRTILTTEKSFPYVKRRLEVIRTDTVKLKPLEVAILNMESKIHELKVVLNRTPCDSKLLQMQLQGGIATAVNQVR